MNIAEAIKKNEPRGLEGNNGLGAEEVSLMNTPETIHRYHVWDRTVRFFHWINVLCVFSLMGVGLVILNNKSLGVTTDGKIILKTVHAYIGYIFAINLAWRFIWGFLGSNYSKWSAILPLGKKYRTLLSEFIEGEKNNNPPNFLGHNPIARLMVTLLFLLLSVQAVTGLVLAGTDLYLPPFGHEIAEWVTNSGEDHSKLIDLKPYSKVNVDSASYKEMRAFRKPFITLHVYVFYTLIGAIFLHLLGVAVTELKEKSGLVSAMLTGSKFFSKKPIDMIEDKAKDK